MALINTKSKEFNIEEITNFKKETVEKAKKLIESFNNNIINRKKFTMLELEKLFGNVCSVYRLEEVWELLSLPNNLFDNPLHLERHAMTNDYCLLTSDEWEHREQKCGRI